MNLSAEKTETLLVPDHKIDEIDRKIIVATQTGLPLSAKPYHVIAEQLDIDADQVMTRIRNMLDSGVIRRIGVVPNHYALGYTANAMTVWDVSDHRVLKLGQQVGKLEFVSHCYRRPRHLPDWQYNLFAMVHGKDRASVENQIGDIASMLGDSCREHAVLFSKRILKKTGLRIQ